MQDGYGDSGLPFLLRIWGTGLFVLLAVGALVLSWRMADDVFDDGDTLVARYGRREFRFRLADVSKVEVTYGRSPMVTLVVEQPGAKPRKIIFVARVEGWSHPHGRGTGEDLEIRVKHAREEAAARSVPSKVP